MEGNYLVFIKNGEIFQSGLNIVPTTSIDKVLTVKKHVAMQIDKLYFDGENLKVRDGANFFDDAQYEQMERQINEALMKEMEFIEEKDFTEPI